MTYIEKLLSGVKVDRELLCEAAVEEIVRSIETHFIKYHCPEDFFCDDEPELGEYIGCHFSGTCKECWNQEAPQ